MKTDDLIKVLVADRAPLSPAPGRMVVAAVAIGAIMSAALFLPLVGIRPDLASAAFSPRFLLKLLLLLALCFGSARLAARLARPDARSEPWVWVLGTIPLVLLLAVVVELLVVPTSQWLARLFGQRWLACLGLIPLFALPILAGLLIAAFGAPAGSAARSASPLPRPACARGGRTIDD